MSGGRTKMDAEHKKRLASKVTERRAASFAKMKKKDGFKTFVRRHEGQTEPPRNKSS